MKRTSLLISSIVILVSISGCLDVSSTDIQVEDRLTGEPIDGSDQGSSHLEEFNSEPIFSLDLGVDQHLIRLIVILNWVDEPPAQSGVPYVNDGETFTVRISDGERINYMASTTNVAGSPGKMYVHLPGDIVDNQTVSDPKRFSVEITLTNAGDQYPYYFPVESLRIDDTGNDYTWSVEYTYVDKS